MYDYLSHQPILKKHSHHHSCSHGHSHTDARAIDKKILKFSLIMTFSMMLVQFVYSIISNSLALLSDTLHMFSDVFALALSFLAIVAVEKWQDCQKTFGYFRLEILVAFINALTIIFSALFIIYEAIEKLITPSEIDAKTMVIIAFLGLIVNAINGFMMFKGANLDNVNMKSAFLHMMSDLLGSVVVIIGGIIVYFTNVVYIDTILALILSLLLIRWAIILLKQSGNILLETSPVNVEKVRETVMEHKEVLEIIDLHITQITNKMLVASMHIKINVETLEDFDILYKKIAKKLYENFEIGHCTIQPIKRKI
ncbi:cation diffusion facilitator family transporter [Campylobacter sp. RM16704]|uniref:cation diffusion facilitator family transporter n=1 Tax=Campylobacter sp. RM16704 TaxID=1500960 RepID=UPI00057F2B1B|nr:cation diffusion facilitator family transporter [Campylobacter sp. RM16704]AJC86523.1 cation diffusion facilitator family transporter [Campylobacter sp. RM16704]